MGNPKFDTKNPNNTSGILGYLLRNILSINKKISSGGSGIQSISGDSVDNTDPSNPVINTPTLVDVLKSPGADNFVPSSPTINLANEFGISDPAAKRIDLAPNGIGFYASNVLRTLTADRTADEFSNYILPLTGQIPGITSEAPVSSGSPGVLGQMYLTTTDLYICIATNTWRKASLTTF